MKSCVVENMEADIQHINSKLRAFLKMLFRFLVRGRVDQVQKETINKHWARVVMNRETHNIVSGLNASSLSVLEISGDTWQKTPFKNYRNVYYPEFDICESILAETFDLIIAEQVFEHLLWPYRAGGNIYKMLNPNGYFLVTTPFLIRIHNAPTDCTRWTETGIKHLLAECGFDITRIQTGSWGNRACVQANFSKWALYYPRFHSLKNESAFPVVVWALAQK